MTFNRIDFWTNPKNAPDELKSQEFYPYTLPEFYLNKPAWSNIINDSIVRYADKSWSILDLGCGTGRGLADLYKLGYRNLSGIEINQDAIEMGKKEFPELTGVSLVCLPIETLFMNIKVEFDVIYSCGCLMHLPYSNDIVIHEIAQNATKMIITAENEYDENFMKFPRKYIDYFTDYGWVQVETETGDKYPPMNKSTVKRVFVKEIGYE